MKSIHIPNKRMTKKENSYISNKSIKPYNLSDKLNLYYQHSINNQERYNFSIVYKYKALPAYVKTLIEKNIQDDLSWFENEFRYYLDYLSGIVIVDAR